MLVVVGANGRTGIEVVKEALRRGRQVRAVVRDDRDARNLDDVIDVQHISYADPSTTQRWFPRSKEPPRSSQPSTLEPAVLARQSTAMRRRQT